jgi:ABC-type glycerol-3-phosphate transport system permease component
VAKPYKHATPICLALTALAIIGAALAFLLWNPLPLLILLLPTAIYEVYRTQGESTKWASWLLLLVVVAEVVLVIANVELDVAAYLEEEAAYVAGYEVPMGDLRVVAPAAMAILAVILLIRTRGVYTKWLAVIIFLSAFAVVYTVDPSYFGRLLRVGVEEGLDVVP